MRRWTRLLAMLLALAVILTVSGCGKKKSSYFTVTFLDVGQADATLIECDGHYMMIDGGEKSDSSRLYSVLKEKEIEKLDLIVATHAHSEHVGGLPGAMSYAKVRKVLCSVDQFESDAFEDFAAYAKKRAGKITIPDVGDSFSLGSAKVTVLGINSAEEDNESCIVLKVEYGKTSFLFTGDAGVPTEKVLIENKADIAATVLHVGHHGSDTSTSLDFLRKVEPGYAVISVGEKNQYGHPTEAVMSRLRDEKIAVYRTDMQGDIICTSDGEAVHFQVEKNAGADVFATGDKSATGSVTSNIATPPPIVQPDTGIVIPDNDGAANSAKNEIDYVLNNNSMKFHYPSCNSVEKIADHNIGYYTGTRGELLAQGYSSCGICHP